MNRQLPKGKADFYADKLWGFGRGQQLLQRSFCKLFGHIWYPPWEGISRCICGGMRNVEARVLRGEPAFDNFKTGEEAFVQMRKLFRGNPAERN